MPNQFSQLFSGLSSNASSPKFKFLQNYGSSNPMIGYPGNTPTQTATPVGGMSIAPRQSTIAANTAATTPVVTKSPSLSTPAAQQYIANQTSNSQPNQTVTAGANTPGYNYVNGKLTMVGGNQIGSLPTNPAPTDSPITGNVQTPSGATLNASTGATVTEAPTDPQASYRAAFDSYMATLNPSAAETAASKNLADLTLQAKKDQEEALNRGETQGFASGEAARVNHNNSFGIDAASNALDSFTANRTAQTGAQKARLDFEKSLLDDSKGDIQKIGNDIVRIGSDGKAEKIYTGTPDVKTQIVQAGGKNILINSDTGAVIKELGATEGALTRSNGVSGGIPGTYTPGENPVVDSWAERIQSGNAKITDIPASQAGLRNAVSVALTSSGNSLNGKPTTTELGLAAKNTAQTLLEKLNSGTGTSAVGKSRIFGYGAFPPPGTDAANFTTDFNSLKSQLALEGVKYLKGQGAVSDAERALLASAVTKLNLSQSEDEFKTTLQSIIDKLNGGVSNDSSVLNTGDPEYDSYLQAIGQ